MKAMSVTFGLVCLCLALVDALLFMAWDGKNPALAAFVLFSGIFCFGVALWHFKNAIFGWGDDE